MIDLTDDEKKILFCLGEMYKAGSDCSTAQIIARSGLDPERAAAALIGLKSKGMIQGGPEA
jgi:hypothetical protein